MVVDLLDLFALLLQLFNFVLGFLLPCRDDLGFFFLELVLERYRTRDLLAAVVVGEDSDRGFRSRLESVLPFFDAFQIFLLRSFHQRNKFHVQGGSSLLSV